MIKYKDLLIVILIALTVILGALFFYDIIQSNNENPIPQVGEKYLNITDGDISKIYLVDSTASYGTLEKDLFNSRTGNYTAHKGDACVFINGTIRNDYERKYWILLTAQLYNESGEKVGKVMNDIRVGKPFVLTVANSNGTTTFSIPIIYDKRDVKNYDIFLCCSPQVDPPP